MKNLKKAALLFVIAIPLVFTSCTKEIPGPQGDKGDKGDKGDPLITYTFEFNADFQKGSTVYLYQKDIQEYETGDVFAFYGRHNLPLDVGVEEKYSVMPLIISKDTTTVVPNKNDLPVTITAEWEKAKGSKNLTFRIKASNGSTTVPVWKEFDQYHIKAVLIKTKK